MRPPRVCPKCREVQPLTHHHVFPRRHYGKTHNRVIIGLCQKCHSELEKLIPFERIEHHRYVQILIRFLENIRESNANIFADKRYS